MEFQIWLEPQEFYFCCQEGGNKGFKYSEKVDLVFFKGSLMQRRGARFLKMRIFGLGQGTSRIQSALLLMPLAQLRQKIIVQIKLFLLLFFDADIKASCNCVKTAAIQLKLQIQYKLGLTCAYYQSVEWCAMLGNKAVQNTFSCAFPIFRDLFQKLWICLGIEIFLGRCNLRRPRTIPFLGVRKYAGTQDKIPSWAP